MVPLELGCPVTTTVILLLPSPGLRDMRTEKYVGSDSETSFSPLVRDPKQPTCSYITRKVEYSTSMYPSDHHPTSIVMEPGVQNGDVKLNLPCQIHKCVFSFVFLHDFYPIYEVFPKMLCSQLTTQRRRAFAT